MPRVFISDSPNVVSGVVVQPESALITICELHQNCVSTISRVARHPFPDHAVARQGSDSLAVPNERTYVEHPIDQMVGPKKRAPTLNVDCDEWEGEHADERRLRETRMPPVLLWPRWLRGQFAAASDEQNLEKRPHVGRENEDVEK